VPVLDDFGRVAGARSVARDVTEARERDRLLMEAHRRAQHLSSTDDLTGLHNRRAFVKEVEKRLIHATRHGHSGALLYLDLDNFKAVNDASGHAAGDDCLRRVAEELRTHSRAGDVIGRLGGDEFAVWLEQADLDGGRRKAEAMIAAVAGLARAFSPPDRPLGLSIGIAASRDNDSAATLLSRAEEAMYRAKHGGKGNWALEQGSQE
jgi:diguanylate cyclase (GGDEF)-like protein